MKLLKYNNGKLNNQLIFSLPAGKLTCEMECPNCYAIKFQRLYPSVLPYRERMYQASLQPDFVSTIISDIQSCKKPLVAVRVHESGEFYSQEYIDAWHTIASSLPHISFYAFTKRLLDFDFTSLQALPNFTLINSLHSGKLNYAPLKDLDPTQPICPDTLGTASCGINCSLCWTKSTQFIGMNFIKH